MPGVNKAEIAAAKEVDLLTYLQQHEPGNFKKSGANEYRLIDHDSLNISNGKWHWHSQGIGGKTALDYLIKVRGYDFVSAVRQINGNRVITSQDVSRQLPSAKPVHRPAFHLPKPNYNNDTIIKYLQYRGIPDTIINHCIQNRLLYQDQAYQNCVFVGLDQSGKPAYGFLRSTKQDSVYMRDAAGSDKRYCFCIGRNNNQETVRVYESAIDAMSGAAMDYLDGKDWEHQIYLSLGGVHKASNNKDSLPIALHQLLLDKPGIQKIIVCTDNDDVGRLCANSIAANSAGRKTEADFPIIGKDWNAYLQIRQGIKNQVAMRGDHKQERQGGIAI